MTARPQMPSARRRAIPGMAASAPAATTEPEATSSHAASDTPASRRTRGGGSRRPPVAKSVRSTPQRRPAADYAATRLVNFRLPVDLHDRFKALVREAELLNPRLRHPSLTELMIALLEEGPVDAGEVVELIRRKRAAEHGAQP
jgi:hypothetical protein